MPSELGTTRRCLLVGSSHGWLEHSLPCRPLLCRVQRRALGCAGRGMAQMMHAVSSKSMPCSHSRQGETYMPCMQARTHLRHVQQRAVHVAVLAPDGAVQHIVLHTQCIHQGHLQIVTGGSPVWSCMMRREPQHGSGWRTVSSGGGNRGGGRVEGGPATARTAQLMGPPTALGRISRSSCRWRTRSACACAPVHV